VQTLLKVGRMSRRWMEMSGGMPCFDYMVLWSFRAVFDLREGNVGMGRVN
jgi:hypothetical protein